MKRTPLYEMHRKAGAKLIDFAGFEMPVQYEGINAEHLQVRNKAGVFDVSHMGNFITEGKDAVRFLQYMTSNDVEKLYPGKVQYAVMTNAKGGIIDDLLVYRLDGDKFMLVVNASNIEKDFEWLSHHAKDFDVHLQNISGDTAILAVQGPLSPAIVQQLTDEPVTEMPFYTHKTLKLAGVDDVLLSTTGYTGEKGYEIYVPAGSAVAVWQALFEAGKNDLKPCGLGARDTLRLEKGYCLYGNDIDESVTPLEARLNWITKLYTGFIGSDALKVQKEKGVSRLLSGFILEGKGIPRHGYDVVDADGNITGKVTSGTQSPVLNKAIGLAYVPAETAKEGTEILIRIRKKDVPAKIVKLPFV
jgi:aminomethyltransferase